MAVYRECRGYSKGWYFVKRIVALIIALGVAAAVSGCARNPEDVKLASPKAMARWCGKQYGAATVIDSTTGDEAIVYTMRDKEKDFTYTAKSYVHTIWLDTVWGYSESKSSDFSEVYRNLFLSDFGADIGELERMYTVSFDFDAFYFAAIHGDDAGDCETAAGILLDLASGFDDRDYWGDMRVDIYLAGEYAGYVGESSGYVSPEEEKAAWLMEVAAMDMRTSVGNLTFVSMETVSCTSLPGYDPDTLSHILGSDNHTKTETDICRFIYDGYEYFVADLVYNDSHGHTRHLGDYPSWCGG